MRTRKANKTKSFSYTDTYGLESDEDVEAPLEVQDAEDDVDFDADETEDGQDGSGDEDEGDEVLNDHAEDHVDLSGDEMAEDGVDGGVDDGVDDDGEEVIPVESGDEGGAGVTSTVKKVPRVRARSRRKLIKRAAVHVIPPYPVMLQQTRVYEGPLKRWLRTTQLVNLLYGPDPVHINVMMSMARKWFENTLLPAKSYTGSGGVMQSPWLAEDYEVAQKQLSKIWYERYRAAPEGRLQQSRKIRPEHVEIFKPPQDDMICSLGPFNAQKQVRTRYGFGQPVLETGEPTEAVDPDLQTATPPRGWLLDTGGLPLGIGWAPVSGHKEQFLAVCTVPYSDQELRHDDGLEEHPEEVKRGSVQIWSIPCHKDDGAHARLVHHIWFDWGRPKRLQWCPVPPPDESKIGMLAVLCADGQVRVFEVSKPVSSQMNYEWMTSPIATLGLPDEYMVLATSLSWVGTNRLCLGHTDGSISLWSIYPRKMLLRRSVHISYVLDIASGFPSRPYHIASTPVGGSPTLTDLNLPSSETTTTPIIGGVNFHNNLTDWNDHLQGFFGMHPSPTPQNTVIGWAHIRFFVQGRTLLTTSSAPLCLASGRTHPFVLVGCADGSLWAHNPLRVLLRDRAERTQKLKVLHHEFRPVAKLGGSGDTPRRAGAGGEVAALRGAARVLQGFLPELNSNPRAELVRDLNLVRPSKKAKSKKKKPSRPEADERGGEDDDGLSRGEGKTLVRLLEKKRAIVHEARTRVVVTAWNPNVEYGWWAAAAMGSGLVKIMDLGIDVQGERC